MCTLDDFHQALTVFSMHAVRAWWARVASFFEHDLTMGACSTKE